MSIRPYASRRRSYTRRRRRGTEIRSRCATAVLGHPRPSRRLKGRRLLESSTTRECTDTTSKTNRTRQMGRPKRRSPRSVTGTSRRSSRMRVDGVLAWACSVAGSGSYVSQKSFHSASLRLGVRFIITRRRGARRDSCISLTSSLREQDGSPRSGLARVGGRSK